MIKDWAKDQNIAGTFIIVGYVMGIIVVPFTLLCYLGVLVVRKKLPVPVWLVVSNILFLFVLLFYIIFLNGNKYPQA